MRSGKTPFILIGIFIVVLAGIAAWFYYRENNKNPVSGLKPRVELGIGRIHSFTDSTLDITLNLLVDNPLPIGINVQDFDYSIQMDSVTIMENRYAEPLRIPSGDSTRIRLPSQLKVQKLKEINRLAGNQEDSADFQFAGIFHLEKPLLGYDTLRLSITKRLPRYHLPSIEVEGYDMKNFGLTESELLLHLRFSNNNAFPIEIISPSYTIDLGSQEELASGQIEGIKTIPAKSRNIYDLPLEISMGELLKAAGQLIAEGKDLPFTLHFSCQIKSDNETFKNSDVKLIIEGTLKDLKKIKENMGG